MTFDDGPDPIVTPRILDVLRTVGVRASFFVIGEKVERHPEIVRRAVAEGHYVGSHSFHHRDPRATPANQLLHEVLRLRTLLSALVGYDVKLFRPPYGKLTLSKCWKLWAAGQTIVLWDVDPKDYSLPTSDDLRSWFQTRPLRGGDLVLLHDCVAHSIDVIPCVAERARMAGLTFATLPEWVS